MNAVIGVHPGDGVAAADSYTQWTGSSGMLNALGQMMGGAVADPAQPGSGNPGSPTTNDSKYSLVGPAGGQQSMVLLALLVVGAIFLFKKL